MNEKLLDYADDIKFQFDVLPDKIYKNADASFKDIVAIDRAHKELSEEYLRMAKEDLELLLTVEEELVPPFVLFPNYGPLNWEIGNGKEYKDIWSEWYKGLSDEEKIHYCNSYHYPGFWFRLYCFNPLVRRYYKMNGNQFKFEELGYLISDQTKENYGYK